MRRYLWFVVLILWFSIVAAQDDTQPHFGTGFVFLRPPDRAGLIFLGEPSPDGRYVVGTSHYPPLVTPGDQLYMWDISDVDPEGSYVQPDPVAAFDLEPWLDAAFSDGSFAFSPDSKSVALVIADQVLLLSSPDLMIQQRYQIADVQVEYPTDMVTWSNDNRALGILYRDTLVVIENAMIYRRPHNIEHYQPHVAHTLDDGWLFEFEVGFMVCSRHLEDCQDYSRDEATVRVYPDTATVLTGTRSGVRVQPTHVWQRDDAGIFHIVETLQSAGNVDGITPDGQYLTVRRMTENGNPNYPYWSLYSRDGQELIRTLDIIRYPFWLNDSGYFIDEMTLYHLSAPATPVAEVPDLVEIGFAEPDEVLNERIGFYHEVWGLLNPTADGRWFMWRVGGTAFMIPVIYP